MSAAKKEIENQAGKEIYDLVSLLKAGGMDIGGDGQGAEGPMVQVIGRLTEMTESLSIWNVQRDDTEERLNQILETLIAISSLDFDHKAEVSDAGDIFDAVAVGLNALSEELESSTVSREFLDNVLRSMVDSLIVLDQDAKIRIVNRAATDLLGYESGELVGQALDIVVEDEEISEFTPIQLNKIAFFRDREIHFTSKYGIKIPVSYSFSVLRDAEGNFRGAVCVGHDITARKKAEEAFWKSENRYKAIVEGTTDLICRFLPDTTLTFVNQAYCQYFNKTREELVGSSFLTLIPEEGRAAVRKNVETLVERKQELTYEHEVVTPSGEIRWQQWTDRPIVDSSGNVGELQSVGRDITERKAADDILKKSLSEKEVLLKEIHHRVKNNLQIISSLLYLQSKKVTDEGTREIFRGSQDRIKAMSLIHEKLYESPDLARINLEAYIQGLLQSLFQTYGVNQELINYHVNVDGINLGMDMAIPCGMIINELVTNALKYAFPEGQEGQVVVEVVKNGLGGCILSVSDNGIGFPESIDFKNTETLGLQLVNNLAGQLDGEISLESKSDGTKFMFTFEPQFALEEIDV